MMGAGVAAFERTVVTDVEQPVRRLAEELGYRVLQTRVGEDRTRLQLSVATRCPAPRLRLLL